ncbi:MAG TPA: hypothetical protein VJH20_05815 [Candidatus Nanoarchaeia archaeon]|nr:hypothetical protein [Candidatus Nanoarchaeia archaeon]
MIKIRTIIEVVGFPEDHIKDAIIKIVDNIKEKKHVKIINMYIEETKKLDKMFATFAELELDMPGLQDVIDFCFDYLPSSVEILEPEYINEKSIDLAGVLNDLMLKLHEYNMVIRNLQAENKVMKNKLDPTVSNNKKNSS